jgi:signal recognition particle subunit SRP68
MREICLLAARCLTIARSHALLSNPKNALALLARASEKCNSAHSYLSTPMDTDSSSPPNINVSPTEVQSLKDLLDGEVQHYRALVELSNLSQTQTSSVNKVRLIERLSEYPAQGVDFENLVFYPPKLEPVPVKPLFFDAAWNYIEYPGGEVEKPAAQNGVKGSSSAESESAEQTAQQKKGWFGFGR